MPATITHAFFAQDVYYLLESSIQQKIKSEKQFVMFAQNTDPLMFYHILSFKKGKNIRSLQSTSHQEKTLLLFKNIIYYMKENKYYYDASTLTFLYGFLTHYVLDSTIHPFIFYKTGNFDKKRKETYKYNGLHAYMETYIDYYLLEKKKAPLDFSFCFDFTPFSKELTNTINYSFENTFHEKNMAKKYYQSLKEMKLFLTLFRKDTFGIKKRLYSMIDCFTPKRIFSFQTLSYHLDSYEKYDFLNKRHKTWVYPVDKERKSTKDFDQLYQEAILKAKNIIEQLHYYFFLNKTIHLESLLGNNSYVTGINCISKKTQKYFEF